MTNEEKEKLFNILKSLEWLQGSWNEETCFISRYKDKAITLLLDRLVIAGEDLEIFTNREIEELFFLAKKSILERLRRKGIKPEEEIKRDRVEKMVKELFEL